MKRFTLLNIVAIATTLLLGITANGQITNIGTGTASSAANSGSITVNKTGAGASGTNTLGSIAVNDILIATVLQSDNDDIVTTFTDASAATWTVIDGSNLESPTNGTNGWGFTVLYKIATAADVSATSFTFNLNNTNANDDVKIASVTAFRGIDIANPFAATNGTITVSTGAGNITAVTQRNPDVANAAILMVGAVGANRTYSTWATTNPASLANEVYDFGSATSPSMSIGAAWALKASTGNTGAGSVVLSDNGTSSSKGGLIIALRPAPIPTQPIGCNAQYYISHGPTTGVNGNTVLDTLLLSNGILTPTSFPLTPGNMGFNAMGLNPVDGYIYAIRYPAAGAAAHLIKIGDGGTTNQTDLGAISGMASDEISYAGCFDSNGDFYFTINSGTGSGKLMKITSANLASRTATQVAANGFSSIYDIAINPVGGQMYGTSSSTTTNYLFPINKSTGVLSPGLGSTSMGGAGFIAGLFFDEVGNLYGYRSDGNFYMINKSNGNLTSAGSANAYDGADGCSCSFGRVSHDLDFTQNPGNQLCPTSQNRNPVFPMTVSVNNQTSIQQTGLTYTLNLGASDPIKRFAFTEDAATIKANLISAGLATAASVVTVAPANVGDPINKLVVTGFQTGAPATIVNFVLQLKLVTLGGGLYNAIPLQSQITGLPALIGSSDASNDPTSAAPDDPTTITFCPNITLPVSLISFSGNYKNQQTSLKWITENLYNFDHFEIERSSTGTNFATIGVKQPVNTASETAYLFSDDLSSVSGTIFYYRLKMIDADGQVKYSNVILVRKDSKNITGLVINPNPVLGQHSATVRFNASANGTVEFRIVDMAGRVVSKQQNTVSEGTNSVAINNIDRLQAGLYVLQMNDGTTTTVTKFTVTQ